MEIPAVTPPSAGYPPPSLLLTWVPFCPLAIISLLAALVSSQLCTLRVGVCELAPSGLPVCASILSCAKEENVSMQEEAGLSF